MATRALITCFSLTGNTEGLARDLAAALPPGSWEFETVREPRPRHGWRGMVRCVRDAITRRTPPIVPPRFRARDYAVVLVGTPVWMGRISGPARTYLATEDFGAARLGVFVTSGGPLTPATRADIDAACPRKPVDVLQFRTHEVHDVVKVDAFLGALGLPLRAGAAPAAAGARARPEQHA